MLRDGADAFVLTIDGGSAKKSGSRLEPNEKNTNEGGIGAQTREVDTSDIATLNTLSQKYINHMKKIIERKRNDNQNSHARFAVTGYPTPKLQHTPSNRAAVVPPQT